MPKSTTKVNYRKIYEGYYGPIPKDNQGRTFHIHHIDGDRNNNDISNLIALSINDHYDIHYQQGDWPACLKLAPLMKIPHDEICKLASEANKERITAGKHYWLTTEHSQSTAQRMQMLAEQGAHPAQQLANREAGRLRALKQREEWSKAGIIPPCMDLTPERKSARYLKTSTSNKDTWHARSEESKSLQRLRIKQTLANKTEEDNQIKLDKWKASRAGKIYWNNGIEQVFQEHVPGPNWVRGRLIVWWTNGTSNTMAKDSPGGGWYRGRTKSK